MKAEREIIEQRLQAFQFDEQSTVDRFCARLARENGWTSQYAARALEEYKRFVLLAVTVEHSVTPSDAVDQVWHLHLTYSDSYWNHFCPEVLGQPLHHHPSKGGASARQRYLVDYSRTLDSYREVFGVPAPADIWPDPALRFGRDLRWSRVNLAEHWVAPRRSVWTAATASLAVLGPAGLYSLFRGDALGLLLAGCAAASALVAWSSRPLPEEALRAAASRPRIGTDEQSFSPDASTSALVPAFADLGMGCGERGGPPEDGAAGGAEGGAGEAADGGDSGGCGGGGCGGCGGCGGGGCG